MRSAAPEVIWCSTFGLDRTQQYPRSKQESEERAASKRAAPDVSDSQHAAQRATRADDPIYILESSDDEDEEEEEDNAINWEEYDWTMSCEGEKRRRLAICHLFLDVHDCPPTDKWDGENGVVKQISEVLGITINGRKNVKKTMNDIMCCIATNEPFTGERLFRNTRASKLIPPGSYEQELIADCIEMGLSFSVTHHIVNEHRREENGVLVGRDAVWRTVKRLNPVVQKTPRSSQGNTDATSGWAIARKNWVAQLLIRLGRMPDDELETLKVDGVLPDHFNIDKLTKLSIPQMSWFDETHRKVTIGIGADFQTKFRRDENGNLDPNGTISGPPRTHMKVKFPEEVRVMPGVTVNPVTGDGVRLPIFSYTSKVVHTIKDYEEQKKKELKRVKHLKGECLPWYVSQREADKIYTSEPVGKLKHIKEFGTKQLNELGIKTVGDFLERAKTYIQSVLSVRGITQQRLDDDILSADFVEGNAPGALDHRKAANPYQSRYGDNWEEELENSYYVNKYECITQLVEHIVVGCKKHYEDTEYEDNWFFYHDALSLMTAKETVSWMKEKGYFKHWVLPELGLNKGTPYAGRPVGNSPEMMPLDCSLNQDVHVGVERHIRLTIRLPEDDPMKFSMSTPSRGFSAYNRVWNCPRTQDRNGELVDGGIPSAKRIKRDINKVVESMATIFENDRRMVDGLGNRPGERNNGHSRGKNGGKRTKRTTYDIGAWRHADAENAFNKVKDNAKDRVKSKQEVDVSKI
jgi:hypothetical protein